MKIFIFHRRWGNARKRRKLNPNSNEISCYKIARFLLRYFSLKKESLSSNFKNTGFFYKNHKAINFSEYTFYKQINLQYIYVSQRYLLFFTLSDYKWNINRKLYHNNPVKLYKSRTRSSTFRFVNLTRDIEVMHNLNEQTTRVSCRSQSTSLFRSSALICSSIEPCF